MHFPWGAPRSCGLGKGAELSSSALEKVFPLYLLPCGCMNIALQSTAYSEHLEKSGAQSPGFHLQEERSAD